MRLDPRTPVLIGAGQVVSHWAGQGDAPSPQGLRAEAARRALADAGGMADAIDRVMVVRTMADSIPGAPQPFGRSANPPGALAAALGLTPKLAVYSRVGGDQPQVLVNEVAEAIFAGEAEGVLIAGSEATAAYKTAQRAGMELDWFDPPGDLPAMEDRGPGPMLLSAWELANGLGAPVRTYPLFEHAIRVRLGLSREAHRSLMSELWSGFSEIAARNPHAQFPTARDTGFLSAPAPENYPLSDPYLKWDVAQDAVNQGAALVLTSVERAEALGIDPSKWVFLHGYAEAGDVLVSERPDLSRSRPIELTLRQALQAAGRMADRIELFDIYSCFPCAVLLAAEALGVDWQATPLTVAGGLPFFGGPGNSYSLHAIATMAERLRARPAAFGLVLANGGFLSKEAVGVYSCTPADGWKPVFSAAIQREIDDAPKVVPATASGSGKIESFTVTWTRGVPDGATLVARMEDGARMIARTREERIVRAVLTGDPIGRRATFLAQDGRNQILGLEGMA